MTNLLFNHSQNKYIAAHLYSINLLYKVLSHSTLVYHLLDQCHKKIKNKIDAWLYTSQFLNLYMDESKNFNKDQAINFLTYASKGFDIERGCFYVYCELI